MELKHGFPFVQFEIENSWNCIKYSYKTPLDLAKEKGNMEIFELLSNYEKQKQK